MHAFFLFLAGLIAGTIFGPRLRATVTAARAKL